MYSTCTPGHRVQPCFHTYAHATRTHTRTHSKLKIPVTPRTTQFSHQENLHARIAVYPRSNRPRTGKRSSEGQNVLGSLVKCYHFVLGLSAIQVHTHTHTHTAFHRLHYQPAELKTVLYLVSLTSLQLRTSVDNKQPQCTMLTSNRVLMSVSKIKQQNISTV